MSDPDMSRQNLEGPSTQGGDITLPGDRGGEGYGLDLNPGFLGGRNRGLEGFHPEKSSGIRTAYDIKDLHDRLNQLGDDDLKGVPVLPPGTPLEQGATYIDLREKKPREFTAMGGAEAGQNNWYVPKTEVDYQVWNRLIGVKNKERLGEADEGETKMDDQTRPTRSHGSRPAASSAGTGGLDDMSPTTTTGRSSRSRKSLATEAAGAATGGYAGGQTSTTETGEVDRSQWGKPFGGDNGGGELY